MKRRHNSGFSLIEALAAFTILSVVLSLVFGKASVAFRQEARSRFEHTALRVARSELARLSVEREPVVGQSTGRVEEGLIWKLTILPYVPKEGAPLDAYWAVIRITNDIYAVELMTLKMRSRRRHL